MARGEIYTFRSGLSNISQHSRDYQCIVLDKDFEKVIKEGRSKGEYTVTVVGEGTPNQFMTCSCFAGSKPICRHRTMLMLFREHDKIDSGAMYEFDKERWVEGPKQDEM